MGCVQGISRLQDKIGKSFKWTLMLDGISMKKGVEYDSVKDELGGGIQSL